MRQMRPRKVNNKSKVGVLIFAPGTDLFQASCMFFSCCAFFSFCPPVSESLSFVSRSHFIPASEAQSFHNSSFLQPLTSFLSYSMNEHLFCLEERLRWAQLSTARAPVHPSSLCPTARWAASSPSSCPVSRAPEVQLPIFPPFSGLGHRQGHKPFLLWTWWPFLSPHSPCPPCNLDVRCCGCSSICPWPQWYALDLFKTPLFDNSDISTLAGLLPHQSPFSGFFRTPAHKPSFPSRLSLSSSSALLQEMFPGWHAALSPFHHVLTASAAWDIQLTIELYTLYNSENCHSPPVL